MLFAQQALANIDKRHHHAAGPLFIGPVGGNSHQVDRAIFCADFAFNRREALENLVDILQKFVVIEFLPDIADRPAQIRIDQIEQTLCRWGKAANCVMRIEQQRRNPSARNKIGQVVTQLGKLLYLVLQLVVYRRELFIHRLELFLGSFQLLIGGLKLFVDGHHLFIGCLKFLVR